ncbi:SRPBCC family protein [Terrimonas pollutisoli]|uniref:SRPBCC family protein n=1 Tax=Terrimonas pollutisoli TaxID=3034147 RepID=UPI0023EAAD23|nr:SRPBCC domain-containing protein [Terrimonas sp. H1YJ31]
MSTSIYDWSRFVVRINVNAPADKLYHAWATRKGIEYWFLRLSEYKRADGALRGNNEFVEKGDTYKWLWHGWPDETVEHGIVLDCNGKDFFKFSFGKAGNCAVTIKKEERETIVELVQDNIPTDEQGMHYWHLGCKTGWTFYLANMKSLYEGGIDLRNKNEKLQQVLNS